MHQAARMYVLLGVFHFSLLCVCVWSIQLFGFAKVKPFLSVNSFELWISTFTQNLSSDCTEEYDWNPKLMAPLQ